MTRKHLLTAIGVITVLIGSLALFAPTTLLVEVKHATPNGAALAMARTVGVLLLGVGGLNLLVRRHEDSTTLRAVLVTDLALQLMILPLDPLAWWSGAFAGLDSFVPNTILHVVLVLALTHQLWRLERRGTAAASS